MNINNNGTLIRKLLILVLPVVMWLTISSPLFADIIYTVEEGDSAWSISIHFGVSLEDLYAANGWAEDENPVLQIGQRIAIPAQRTSDESTESDDESETSDDEQDATDDESTEVESGETPAQSETTYIVQPGDNPYMIAHRFGLGTLVLLEFNGMTEDSLIHPGQMLSIPPADYDYQGLLESETEDTIDETPAPEPVRYYVQSGDNPWTISRQYGINTQTLLAYNNLSDDSILHIGDELLIPVDAGNLASRSSMMGSYTVAAGDTLSEIAQAHGITTTALAEANNMSAGGILREGQQLMVPGNRTTPANPVPSTPQNNTPPPTPDPPRDLSEVIEPLPEIVTPSSNEELVGWHSELFDFTQIETAVPSTCDPIPVADGDLSVDGNFDDGTPYHLYTVRRGDTISELADEFDITQSELMSRNGIDIRTSLRIGRDLRVPLPRPATPVPASGNSGGFSFGAPDAPVGSGSGTETGIAVVTEATRYLGTPYVWAGTSLTGGVDCSGFTMSVYSQFGVSLPHRASEQATYGVEVAYSDMIPGDLVFFHTTRSGISHVGLYIGGGEFVHSSSHRGGVVISPIDTGYYNQRFVCARRVL